MFSLFIICYLFLAGTGSGAYAIAALFAVFGHRSIRDGVREYRVITKCGFWLGPLLVAFGAVLLVFDLGSPERAFTIFLTPKLTILSFGAWAVLLFCLLAGLSFFLHNTERTTIAVPLLRVVEAFTFLTALAVMIYTGVLVSSMPNVPLLHSPLIIALFIISSFSSGAALITLYGFLNQHRKSMRYGLRIISRIDLVCIMLEVVVIAALFAQKYFESDIARNSVRNILLGENLPVFWFGVVFLGLMLPVILWLASRKTAQPQSSVTWALSAAALLIGAFALRYCLISGGLYVPVELIV